MNLPARAGRAIFVAGVKILSGCQARWEGVEPVDPVTGVAPRRVYFANHTSNLDAPVIWASLPRELRDHTRPIAAKDYWGAGPVRRYFATRVLNAVLIERVKVTRSCNPLIDMEAALEAGDSLIIFPEGTRSLHEDGRLNAFKPGLYHLARKHPGVQFVPVFLENLNRILPKGEFLFVPLLAAVRFGVPLRLEDGEDKQTFLTRARQALSELSDEPVPTVAESPLSTAGD